MLTVICPKCCQSIPYHSHYRHICPPSYDIAKQLHQDFVNGERDKEIYILKQDIKELRARILQLEQYVKNQGVFIDELQFSMASKA